MNDVLLIKRVLERDKKINRLLGYLDQISAMTKNGRASRTARAAASFERMLHDGYIYDSVNN